MGRNLEGQEILRLKARLNVAQIGKGPEQQARADRQRQGQRDFDNDQHATQTTAGTASADPARAFFERTIHIHAQHLPSRGKAEDDTGQKACRQTKDQYTPIQIDFVSARNHAFGQQLSHGIQSPDRQQQSSKTSHQRQDHTFGQ